MLKKITLLRDRVQDWKSYPFSVPTIHGLDELDFRSRICFFAGENGTGKSTLLEAVAAHYGFGPEGGTRSFPATALRAIIQLTPWRGPCDCLSTRERCRFLLARRELL